MPDLPPTFGKYQIKAPLGRGGFATVYRAHDASLDRDIALKILAPHLAWEPDTVARFKQEARIAARLKHPNIVAIHEIGEVDGQIFIAMELIEGESLRDYLKRQGSLSVEETIALLAPIADALDYAHSQGVVHRDVKPANILLETTHHGQTRPVLSDFGLVKSLAQSTEITQSGAVLGTVEYMAPEQADSERANEIGPATDLYALGIVAYHMLTGQVPFTGSSAQVLVSHLTRQPPSPRSLRADLPDGPSQVLLKALAKRPADRFASAAAFVQALRTAEGGHPDAAAKPAPRQRPLPRWWPVVPLVLVAVVAVAGYWLWTRGQRDSSVLSCGAAAERLDNLVDWEECKEVIRLATDVIERGCQLADIYKPRSVCYAGQGRLDLAFQDINAAIDLDPGYEQPYLFRASLYRDSGKFDLALADLNKAIELAPTSAEAYFERASYYEDRRQWQEVLADIQKAIAYDPTTPDYYDLRGIAHQNLGQIDQAIPNFQRFLELTDGKESYSDRREQVQTILAALPASTPTANPTPTPSPTPLPEAACTVMQDGLPLWPAPKADGGSMVGVLRRGDILRPLASVPAVPPNWWLKVVTPAGETGYVNTYQSTVDCNIDLWSLPPDFPTSLPPDESAPTTPDLLPTPELNPVQGPTQSPGQAPQKLSPDAALPTALAPPSDTPAPTATPTSPAGESATNGQPWFGPISFCLKLDADNRCTKPMETLPSGTRLFYISWQYRDVPLGASFQRYWYHDDKELERFRRNDVWDSHWISPSGYQFTWVDNGRAFPNGEYRVDLFIENVLLQSGSVKIGN